MNIGDMLCNHAKVVIYLPFQRPQLRMPSLCHFPLERNAFEELSLNTIFYADLTEDTDFTVSVRISKFIDPYEIGTLTYDVESPPISKEAIIVIIVVGVLLVAFIIAIGVYCFRKNRRYKANKYVLRRVFFWCCILFS